MKHGTLAVLAAAATLLAAPSATARDVRPAPTPGPSTHAVVQPDGPGDVWTFSNTTTGYQPAVQPAADVLTARIIHGRYAVSVRMVFDDLQRVDSQWYYCDIHTAGVTSYFILEAARGHWRGTTYQDVDGEWVRVPGFTDTIDYASDVVTLRISRRLLGEPRWVRVRLGNQLGLPDHNTFFTDNPSTASPHPDFTRRLRPR